MINYLFRDSNDHERVEQLYSILSNRIQRPFDRQAFSKLLDYISPNTQYTIKRIENLDEFKNEVYNGYTYEDDELIQCIFRRNACVVYGNCKVGYRQKDKVLYDTKVNSDEKNIIVLCDTERGYIKKNKKSFYKRHYTIVLFMSGGDS